MIRVKLQAHSRCTRRLCNRDVANESEFRSTCKKLIDDHAMVIDLGYDLDDEIKEEER